MGYLNFGATEARSYLAIRVILAPHANVIALLFECV